MNPRTTAILFLVALVLGGFIYWHEFQYKADQEAAEELSKRLFPDLETSDLESIRLTTSDGADVELVRAGDDWRLSAPVDFPADRTALDSIGSALAELTSEAVIDAPQSPEVYGLGDEATVVEFEAAGEAYDVEIGDKTPVGNHTYAATSLDERVFTVASYRAQSLRRELTELREKRLLHFDRRAVSRIELAWPDGGVTLARQGADGWRLVAPIEERADETIVDTLLSDLSFLRATDFLDEPPPDATASFETPRLRATISFGEEAESGSPAAPLRLEIGGEWDDDQRLARTSGERSLYRIPRPRLDDFPRELGAYRYKQLAEFAAEDVERLVLVFSEEVGGASRSVEVVAEHGEPGWTSEPEVIAAGKLPRMVSELSRLRATAIVAEEAGAAELPGLGLAPPAVVIRAEGRDGRLAEIRLGRASDALGILAQTADSEKVYSLDYALAEHLPISLEAFRNRFVSSAEDPDGSDGGPTPELEGVVEGDLL